MENYHKEIINLCGENSPTMLKTLNKMYEVYLYLKMHKEVILNTQKRISIFKALYELENDSNSL
jgi:ABC-type phosphate transport system ATPase subunit